MSSSLTFKEWESLFFHQSIYDYSCDVLAEPNWPANALVTAKVNAQSYSKINTLNSHGFLYCEGDVSFEKSIVPFRTNEKSDLTGLIADESSISELQEIITDLYVSSRFREPWFSTQQRDSFYQTWLENAVRSTFDDCCLIIKDNHKIIGFITVKIIDAVATIGLIGVHRGYHGKGIGGKLLDLVSSYSRNESAIKIKVSTQISNVAAMNLYNKHDFRLLEISHWFYKKVPA